jgi:hypothetical protein
MHHFRLAARRWVPPVMALMRRIAILDSGRKYALFTPLE